VGSHAFHRAFERWVDPASKRTLSELAREAVDELRLAAAALG
jgi:hypothetical protein